MILTGKNILEKVRSGEITISPFLEDHINPNSYNYRIGSRIIQLSSQLANDIPHETQLKVNRPLAQKQEHLIPPEGFILQPNNLYIANTLEVIGSPKHITSLIGKSSMGRLGLFLQVSANLGHQGVAHQWTLELCCRIPIRIYPFQIIGQICFWEVEGETLSYNGYYGQRNQPTLNKDYQNYMGDA